MPVIRNTEKHGSNCKGRREMHYGLGIISGVTIFSGKEQGLVLKAALYCFKWCRYKNGMKSPVWVWEPTTLWVLSSVSFPHMSFQISNTYPITQNVFQTWFQWAVKNDSLSCVHDKGHCTHLSLRSLELGASTQQPIARKMALPSDLEWGYAQDVICHADEETRVLQWLGSFHRWNICTSDVRTLGKSVVGKFYKEGKGILIITVWWISTHCFIMILVLESFLKEGRISSIKYQYCNLHTY